MIHIQIEKQLGAGDQCFVLSIEEQFDPSRIYGIQGESGAGKTTLLRAFAGLDDPDSGKISVMDELWYSNQRSLPIQQRNLGFVFQDLGLFPNMTVLQHLQFAGGDAQSAEDLLREIDMWEHRNKKPAELSGGQQQRCAIGRSLASGCKTLLLDEPFSSLDLPTRIQLQDLVLRVQRKFDLTVFMVSHDTPELAKMSHEILILNNGKVVFRGAPDRLISTEGPSAKFKLIGEILSVKSVDVLNVLTVAIGNQVVKVVADPSDAEILNVGDQIVMASKAFNPVIQKLDQ